MATATPKPTYLITGYDGGHVLAEYDGNGNLLRKYVYGARVDEPVCMIENAPTETPPLAHWKFDEGSGTTAYDSAGSNDGTIYGATWTTGKLGGALDFDGTDDYVDCGNDSSLSATTGLTMAGWIKFDASKTHTLLMKNLAYGVRIWPTSIQTSLWDDSGGSNFSSSFTYQTNTWYHIAVAWGSGSQNIRVYVDGDLIDDGDTFSGPLRTSLPQDLLIGKVGWTGDYFTDGKIDDVRIYDVALSDNEIEQLYDQGQSTSTYYYHYDGLGSVVALSDSAGDTVQTYEYSVYGQVAASDPNHPNLYLFTPVLAFARKHGGDSIFEAVQLALHTSICYNINI